MAPLNANCMNDLFSSTSVTRVYLSSGRQDNNCWPGLFKARCCAKNSTEWMDFSGLGV